MIKKYRAGKTGSENDDNASIKGKQ